MPGQDKGEKQTEANKARKGGSYNVHQHTCILPALQAVRYMHPKRSKAARKHRLIQEAPNFCL